MTETSESIEIPSLARLPSGIDGLDQILKGGFFRAGLYIIQGVPGTGKTILGNHLCFSHAAAGGNALYLTLLAESHHRMLAHIRDMRFFDPKLIAKQIHYLSAFRILEQEGLAGLLTLIRREIVSRKISLLVLDGLVQAGATAASDTDFKKFINSLQTQAAATDCTMFLLTSAVGPEPTPEHTMVDGMIKLVDEYSGWIANRNFTVTKFRGSSVLRGRHAFRITDAGIHIFPRLEAAYSLPSRSDGAERARLSSGVAGLDVMLGGGLPAGSCSLLLGPTGSGKTTLGLHFLGKASAEEPALMFGFYETPAQLLRKAATLLPTLTPLVEQELLTIHWQPATERLIDQVGHELLDLVRRRRIRRLVVDGLRGFDRLILDLERSGPFFTALSNELRALGVTSIFTLEVADLVGPVVKAPQNDLTQLADNLVLLRFAEQDARLYRLASILKVRDSDFDPTVREFMISPAGIGVLEPFENFTRADGGGSRRNRAPEADAPTTIGRGGPAGGG